MTCLGDRKAYHRQIPISSMQSTQSIRQQYDACACVHIQGCRKCLFKFARVPQDKERCRTVPAVSSVVLLFPAFLSQPSNKAQSHCTVISWQPYCIRKTNTWLRTSVSVVRTPCMPYSSVVCLAAAFYPPKSAR